MWRALVVFCSLIVPVFAQSIPQAVLSSPVRLEMDRSTVEVAKGVTVNYTVTLKNGRDRAVAAPAEMNLEIETPSGKRNIIIPRGQSSVSFQWTAAREGMARIVVHSGNLHPASCLVVVTPARLSAVMREMPVPVRASPPESVNPNVRFRKRAGHRPGAEIAAEPQPAPPPPPPAAATQPQPARPMTIRIFVEPDPILGNAAAQTWTASVAVAAQDDQQQLVPVPTDVTVHFTSNMGQLKPTDVVIPHGQTSTFNSPVTLVAGRSGKDHLEAISSIGTVAEDVEYQAPIPSQLWLDVGSADFSANGGSTAVVHVCMQDDAGNLTAYPDRDTQITLSPDSGQLEKTLITITRGNYCSDQINWTSHGSGLAHLTARSSGELKAATAQTTFPSFPWYLVLLAAAGGLVGAFVKTSGQLFSKKWLAHLWRNLVVGGVVGVIVYLLAYFGALVLPKEIPIKLQNIPAVTGLGALVLGVIGGLYGRKLLKVDDDEADDKKATAKAGGD